MAKSRSKTESGQTYTIYLLKEEISSIQDAVDPAKIAELTEHDLVDDLGLPGTLFIGNSKQYEPRWVRELNPFLKTPVTDARIATVSAILVVQYEKRIFAATFGWGKTLLRKSSWVRDFGLKVTLNRVDPKKLRSIDTKTYEDIVVSTRKQTSRSSAVESFEVDIARNLLRAVTGVTKDQTFFKRLTGADSINLTTELGFKDFGDLLDELLVAYADKKYKRHFGWIDNVKEVDSGIKEALNAEIVSALQNGEIDNMHLAPADVVEWGDIQGFNYTGGKRNISYPELQLVDYLEVLGDDLPDLSIENLQRQSVRVRFEDTDNFVDQWSVYECLVWDTELRGNRYVLFDGRWFEVNKSYAQTVEEHVAKLSAAKQLLPDSKLGVKEGTYNEGVAENAPAKFVMLDGQTIQPAGAATPIEFCDLMSNSGQLIHVKKRSSSATLSHLFSQGSVAAGVFLQDSTARKAIRARLLKLRKKAYTALIPTARPTAGKYEIVYAILAKDSKKWPPRLPFFSGVNLMHHSGLIRTLGYKVSLHFVRER